MTKYVYNKVNRFTKIKRMNFMENNIEFALAIDTLNKKIAELNIKIAKDLYDNFYSASIPRKPNDTIKVYIKSKQLPYKHIEDMVIFVRK